MTCETSPLERDGCLAMHWPEGGVLPTSPPLKAGYSVRVGIDRPAFEAVSRTIGFTVTDAVWTSLLAAIVPGAMVVVWAKDSDESDPQPVAVAAAERREGPWVELGWVAVASGHRGHGLGHAVCHTITEFLLHQNETSLFGSTQDHRIQALNIYLALGFHPIHRPVKSERWRDVCRILDTPFAPAAWGWPA